MIMGGILLLVCSLFPTRELCRKDHQGVRSWKVLGALTILFIIGYLAFAILLLDTEPSRLSLIVSLILFGGSVFVILVVRNAKISIGHIMAMVEAERYRALHDDLTELPNRTYLQDRLDNLISRTENNQASFAVFLLDLNRFKEVNDALGHFYGDYLLQKVALRLREVIQSGQTLARWGGDKFAFLFPDLDRDHAIRISYKINDIMARPFKIEGKSLSVGISIGIAVFPDHGQDTESILQHADIAMYEAKRNHVDYAVFDPMADRATWNRLTMLGDLRSAIAKGQLLLHYQPQVSVLNGSLSGVEALIRWQHDERGLVYPSYFIELAEQAGLSKALTSWVLDNALKQMAQWKKAGVSVPMSVNLSIKNLHDYDFSAEVAGLLKKWEIRPEELTLEITESSIMVDPGRVTTVVGELKEIGVKLSIDDFGTGYSSLSYLRKFPAGEIKIDKSFVMDMLKSEDSAVIVKSTIDMAHNIGRWVVAEGVENNDTQILLKRLGCDFIQGFHVSHPLPPDQFLDWYRTITAN